MKKYIKYAFSALAFMGLATSCDNFGDVNIDPENPNEGNISYSMVFTNAQIYALGSDWDIWRNGIICASQWNQHTAAIEDWWPYALNEFNEQFSTALWSNYSADRSAPRDATYSRDFWKANNMQDCYNIARILRVYIYNRYTDLYGDVPYSESMQPIEHPNPKYDSQEFIYKDLLKELDEAQAALTSGTAAMGKQDIYYQGDIASWKKFANSLMLRLAMRMSKVDPTEAAKWAAKAYENGLQNGIILENKDNCKLEHPEGTVNNIACEQYAKIFSNEDVTVHFINKTFYDILKKANDPRIPLIMNVVTTNDPKAKYGSANYVYGNSDPEVQKGLPGGYALSKSSDYFIGLYYPEFNDDAYLKNMRNIYSQPNRYTYAHPQSPTFICTAAQTNLLLAEAAYRGWIKGSAKEFYNAGVKAAMEQFQQFPKGQDLYATYMSEEKIQKYLEENAFDESKALEQINTQYWINCFCDEYETFANVRRSGFPELKYPDLNKKEYPGVFKGFPRRFTYPSNEGLINTEHYEEAVNKLEHGNTFESRMWWDAK